jgi:hypothetical protein
MQNATQRESESSKRDDDAEYNFFLRIKPHEQRYCENCDEEERRKEERHTCRRRRGVSSSCRAVFSLDHHHPHQEGLIRSCMPGTGGWNGTFLDPSCSAPDGRGSDIWWRSRAHFTQEKGKQGKRREVSVLEGIRSED